ncbi:MAG: GHKL domain-containing protein [Pseudomonadales bacterium]|nr:GHKL domain-containing protein [Pseudomonadales bacterium]
MGVVIDLPWIRQRIVDSLQGRLLVSATVLLCLFLGSTGFILEQAFLNGIESNVKERLQIHIYALLTAAEENDGKLMLPVSLQEQRLNQIGSGLYGIVSDAQSEVIWLSESALGLKVSYPMNLKQGQQRFGRSMTQDDDAVFYLTQGITWEMFSGVAPLFNVTIVESQQPFFAQRNSFRQTLWGWLGGIALLLLLFQWILLRWGMKPLDKMRDELLNIEKGKANQLQNHYPMELQGLMRTFNLLVENEIRQRERYKNTMSDLAHSLKTPLAVLRGFRGTIVDLAEYQDVVEGEVQRMDQIVQYQLQRTVAAGPSTIVSGIEIKPVAIKMLNALKKIYLDKKVQQTTELGEDAVFPGGEEDLMELIGNLLDNAYKHSRSIIALSVTGGARKNEGRLSELVITIEDDGAGIPLALRDVLLTRGARLDTQHVGQGIGLAVVSDIVKSYGGKIRIADSRLGGAKFILIFPER